MAFTAESLSVHCQYTPQVCWSNECYLFSELHGLILACWSSPTPTVASVGMCDTVACTIYMLTKYMETVVGDIQYSKIKVSFSSLFFFLS